MTTCRIISFDFLVHERVGFSSFPRQRVYPLRDLELDRSHCSSPCLVMQRDLGPDCRFTIHKPVSVCLQVVADGILTLVERHHFCVSLLQGSLFDFQSLRHGDVKCIVSASKSKVFIAVQLPCWYSQLEHRQTPFANGANPPMARIAMQIMVWRL